MNFIENIAEPVIISEKLPFKAMETKTTKGQTFGRPKLIKAGKEFDVHDWIQEGREDTEIYPTLEKYGCIDRMKLDIEGVFGDFTEMNDLRGTIEKAEKAQKMWDNLPLETREHFQNNKALFIEGGMDYIKNLIKQKQEQKQTESVQGADNKGESDAQ